MLSELVVQLSPGPAVLRGTLISRRGRTAALVIAASVVYIACRWFVGIAFQDNLEEILKYVSNPATQDYIVQKYIGTVSSTLLHCCC